MEEYHKIDGIFERDLKSKKLIEGKYRSETVEFLKDLEWEFTEKIDGTNIRVHWDGHNVEFGGRTDNAQIPAPLTNRLVDLFKGQDNEELFEQKFGAMEVTLYGEGYGAKIQNGGLYRDTQELILFDVKIGSNWQPRSSVDNIAKYFGIESVPVVLTGTIEDGINYVKGKPKSTIGTADMEGVVGRPKMELLDRCGKRVIVKIKARDW